MGVGFTVGLKRAGRVKRGRGQATHQMRTRYEDGCRLHCRSKKGGKSEKGQRAIIAPDENQVRRRAWHAKFANKRSSGETDRTAKTWGTYHTLLVPPLYILMVCVCVCVCVCMCVCVCVHPGYW